MGSASVGLFGKHPTAGDFLRVEAASELVRAFDRWLSAALVAGERLSSSWPALYAGAPPVFFLFHGESAARSARCLLGLFVPSADRAGRAFPLVVFSELELAPLAAAHPVLPYHRFLHDALRLLSRREQFAADTLAEAVRALPPPGPGDLEAAQARHDQYLDRTDGALAMAAIFGAGALPQQRAALALLEGVGRAVGANRARVRYGTRCPLGAAPINDAALWLAILQRVCPAPVVPLALWSDSTLLLHFDQLGPKSLAALWCPRWQDDSVCDLATVAPADEHAPPGRQVLAGQPLRVLLERR